MSLSLCQILRARRGLAWAALIILTGICMLPLELMRLPASPLLGAMLAAIIMAAGEIKNHIPEPLHLGSQSLIGCLIAQAFSLPVLYNLLDNWPLALFSVVSAILFSAALGWIMTVYQVLPGNTAIWGTSPGAATIMVLMSQDYGADDRLVALMQYLRLMTVAVVATIVGRFMGVEMTEQARPDFLTMLFPAFDLTPFLLTLLLIAAGAWLGHILPIPVGPMLLTMALTIILHGFVRLEIVLPEWLRIISYTIIGWGIGQRFTRSILIYALHALPKILGCILTLLALCGGVGAMMVHLAGVDPLTAYLATSPGGADSVAIIAASSDVDMGFVMSIQMARFLLVMVLMPPLARFTATRADKWRGRKSGT